MDPRATDDTTDGEFFTPARRPHVFDPAGQYRRSLAGQTETPEAARKRRRTRRRTINRVVAGCLLVGLCAGAWFAYPTVWSKVSTSTKDSMVQEIGDVATAEQSFHGLYGYYTTDRTQLTLGEDGFNDVRIVSTNSRTFCLAADSLLGQKLFYTPSTGVTEVPCV